MHLPHIVALIKPVVTCALAVLLVACSSSPETQPKIAKPEVISPIEKENAAYTPQELIEQARHVWQQERDAAQRDALLLDAAAMYINQSKVFKAQALLKMIERSNLSPTLRERTNLLIAQVYMDSSEASASELLTLVSPLSTNKDIRQQQLQLQTDLYHRLQNWAAAADALISSHPATEETIAKVWQWSNHIPKEQLGKAQQDYPALRPYLALRSLVATYGLQPAKLSENIVQFKRVFRGHPLLDYLPESVTRATQLSIKAPEDIVVLLPLSGRLEATGNAVKEGIVAAYFEHTKNVRSTHRVPTLRFVDTVNKSDIQLVEEIGESRWVIGPLIKETIEHLHGKLPPSVNMLALNRISLKKLEEASAIPEDKIANSMEQPDTLNRAQEVVGQQAIAYFALAPEDEAAQLAELIFVNGYRAPVVITSDSNINQRMLASFSQRWQELNALRKGRNKISLTKVTFTDNSSLKEGVTQALDVAQSEKRINQIRYMLNEELYNMPRNREDIDAIVAFASPEQTELLNPMIEASINPFFGKTVPVYATSRSVEYDSTKNQWRDLQNVRFLDMPWMLPHNPKQEMKQQLNGLWQDRSTQESRLFAFGIDAYQLLPHLASMALLPQVAVAGLTGELSMNKNGEIIRTLPQALISNQKVTLYKPLQ
ncbi:penicillin-binding protein activator [Alteromonas ponticola]|uniref:Penicillin-binding protein activator n=1 Tax=Alteromonas aquimaris TaxID=2998417 RepID=A0ABT3P2K6_9ALTE|nr:penicillin-binding protein activator [Alteromonas aquimaris]MCW8106988.1 penicillin-binding protein activator [Alteromonas aquimaris]